MEVVVTICNQCDAELGRFRNCWNRIGKSYHSPVYPPVAVSGLEATGPLYNGAKDSHVEHSHLQDIACINCQTVVGLRCESAPEGHMLKKNQLIIGLVDVYVVSAKNGEKAKLSILKSFPLSINSSKKLHECRRSATARPSHHTSKSEHGTSTSLHAAVGSRKPSPARLLSVSSTNVSMLQLTKFKDWAEDVIETQQKHIDRISGTVGRIERDMRLFNDFILETRAELTSIRQIPSVIGHGDLSALREDVDDLRREVEINGQVISRVGDDLPEKSSAGIVNDVELLSKKITEVDELRSAYTKIKARVELLEKQSELQAISEPREHSDLRQNKRKKGQMDGLGSPQEGLTTESLQKKRKITVSSTHGQRSHSAGKAEHRDRRTSPQTEVVEISSAAHESPSPILGQDDTQKQLGTLDNAQYSQSSIPNSTASTHFLEESSRNRKVAISTRIPTADKGYSAVPQAGISRIEVRVPYSTARAMSLQQEAIPFRNDDDLPSLPSGGKVDGRSLRFKALKANKENLASHSRQTPLDRQSTPVMRSRRNADLISDSVAGRQDSVSPREGDDAGEDELFQCGGCGKEYRSPGGLDYHHVYSEGDCRSSKDDLVPRIFQCEKCKTVYRGYPSLEYHRKNSTCCHRLEPHASSLKPSACDVRSKTFMDKSDFSAHKCNKPKTSSHIVKAKESKLAERERIVRATLEREIG